MDRYASFVAAKRGMADSLRTMVESGAVQINQMHARIVAAVDLLLQAGAADGTLRSDVAADDVVSSLIGIFITSRSPDQTGRMLDLLVAESPPLARANKSADGAAGAFPEPRPHGLLVWLAEPGQRERVGKDHALG